MRREDRGSASLELVIVAPFLLALMMLIIAFGRYAQTENLVDQAARDAARAATAQNVRADVPKTVNEVIADAMADAPSSCRDTAVADPPVLSKTAFDLPDPNNPLAIDTVSVTVHCTLDLSDLAALPLKSVHITRTFTSPLDRYRGYR
ncbi:TadE family protein [Aeromicrobium ginsengisoli]|uniref:Pilus assembly protein n=1 Tax=Aeromicrobium ginsengisoli TaxID=363867 RepID=A0A5M4FB05_9ACTN|nr:TadE family protein [Aeromicrobium ginsengisoli]KAA1395524.1 pilus assembly protein [Aeromicrobium ginsengisoli]